MSNYYLYIFIIIFLSACNIKKEKNEVLTTNDSINSKEISLYPIFFDKEKNYAGNNNINIQDIGSVKYVKLETDSNCLLTNKWTCEGIYILDDNIFISYGKSIFRFGMDGKFINSIGRQGEGPEEFITITAFTVDENKKEILVSDLNRRRTLIFNYDGSYKRNINHEYYFNRIAVVNDSTMLCSTDTGQGYSIIFLSSIKNGKTTKILLKEANIELKNTSINISIISKIRFYNNNIIQTTLQDSIFSINKNDLELTARYIQLPSSKTLPEGKMKTLPYLIFETDRYSNIISGRLATTPETYIIDKKTNTITTGRFVDKERGEKIMPFGTNKDNIIVDLYDSFDLQKLLNENKLSGSLKQIAEELKEEDNPVLMIATIDS